MPDVTVPAPPPLVTVRNVELVQAGTWMASTGEVTFTPEHLAQAVAALDCPAVRNPIIAPGHDAGWDGQPAIGYIDNMATTGDTGGTLVGDYCGMPSWLALPDADGQSVLTSAWPDRSIEGEFGYVCQLGHTHPFVIHALKLLGVTRPGVGTLQSLNEVAALYGVAASSSREAVVATISLAVNTDQVRQAYYAEHPTDSMWIQEIHVSPLELIVSDDSDGKIYRVPVEAGEDAVTFGEQQQVVVRYEDVPDTQNVAASIAAAGGVRYPSRNASRPGSTSPNPQEDIVPTLTDDHAKAIVAKLGVAEDADGDTIVAALQEALDEGAEDKPDEAKPTTVELPEGVVAIDATVLADMQQQIAQGVEARQEQVAGQLEGQVAAAVREGRIPAGRRDHYLSLLKADPEGTTVLLGSLAPGLVPVEQQGIPGGETAGDSQLDAMSAALTGKKG